MSGAEMIAAERQRQIDAEGYDPDHDDAHTNHELIRAAYGYLIAANLAGLLWEPMHLSSTTPELWPWSWEDWKPDAHDAVPNLVKAGALIAAEIDRRLRAVQA